MRVQRRGARACDYSRAFSRGRVAGMVRLTCVDVERLDVCCARARREIRVVSIYLLNSSLASPHIASHRSRKALRRHHAVRANIAIGDVLAPRRRQLVVMVEDLTEAVKEKE